MTSGIVEQKVISTAHSSGESMLDQMAAFVVGTKYEHLPELAIYQAKTRILDALACAIGALDGEPIQMIREQIQEFGGQGLSTLIGGGRTAPEP